MKVQRFLTGSRRIEKQIVTIIAIAVAVLLTAVCGTWEGPPPRVPKIHPPQPPMMQEIYSVALSALSPDGMLVAGANRESSTIKISKVPDNRIPLATLQPDCSIQGTFKSVFSPDSSRLAFICWDHRVAVWDFRNSKTEYLAVWEYEQATQLAWSRDGKFLAAISPHGRIRTWANDRAEKTEFATNPTAPLSSFLFISGDRLVVCDTRGRMGVWDRSGHLENSIDFAQPVAPVAALPDGKQIMIVLPPVPLNITSPSQVIVWNTATGERNQMKGIEAYNPQPLAFSGNGEYLVLQFDGRESAVFSMRQRRYVKSLNTDSPISQGAFSPDGMVVLMGKTVSLWKCCP